MGGGTVVDDDSEELALSPVTRAQLYRERAAALETELGKTDLPRLREKLRAAADRFLELAVAEEDRARRRAGPEDLTRAARLAEALGPYAALLGAPFARDARQGGRGRNADNPPDA